MVPEQGKEVVEVCEMSKPTKEAGNMALALGEPEGDA